VTANGVCAPNDAGTTRFDRVGADLRAARHVREKGIDVVFGLHRGAGDEIWIVRDQNADEFGKVAPGEIDGDIEVWTQLFDGNAVRPSDAWFPRWSARVRVLAPEVSATKTRSPWLGCDVTPNIKRRLGVVFQSNVGTAKSATGRPSASMST